MTEAVKKRIAEINSGIVPDGYKKTKVGIVPVEWEVEYIGNICKIQTGKSNTQDAEENGLYPFFVRSPIVYKSNGYLFDCETVITVGDGVGTGKVFHYYNGKFDLHQRNYAMTDFNGVLGRYFYYFFSYYFYKRVMSMTAKTSVDSVRYEMIDKMSMFLPPLAEQQKIAEILSTQDKLIELHEKKVEKLKELKKAYLQKMFPQKGSKYPEIRFKGFTDDWEQRKVSDICTNMSAGGDVDKSKLVDNGKYPVIANALTNEGIVGYYNDEYRIKAPAVTVTGRGDVGHAKARKVDFTPVVRLLTLETEHDVDFLENAINTVSIVNESTGVPQLTVPQLSQYTLSVPPTLEEEKAIGEYLLSFDTLITLHQRKLDKEKEKKKALMQLLLTGKVRVKP